ncbi:MAG TPA: transporter [Flavobacteriaceae bacterium]|nr:transporter [Flavobacteriaceae bacterium]HBS11555.1 transporter [Flavobacteriaceae bacterium]
MINKIIYTVCLFMLISSSIKAQNNIDDVLLEIAKNNKSIKENQQYIEAKKLQYKTGLTLKNPSVEYEYLNGSPANAGNQTDFLILQSFDFPTAYSKKKQVAELQIGQTDFQLTAIRQDILLDAKQICIKLIYYNKKQAELEKRLQNVNKLNSDYQKKLNNGEANILDANKAKLQLINLQNDMRFNSSKIIQITQKLTELNGGIPIEFNDTVYQIPPTVPYFNSLMDSIESNSPSLKSLQQEKEINQKKVELTKALTLPKMEAGYRYQSILGQQYQGVHFGLTIPLWENINTVKFQKAQTLFSEVKVDEHKNQHHSEIKQLYEKYQNLNITLSEYKQILTAINNTELLEKSLKLGEISSIQYFMEINYFYNSFDKYLQLEKEYYLVIAELYKYRL